MRPSRVAYVVDDIYSVAVDRLYTIELEPEVRDWLEALPAKHFLKIDEYVGLLASRVAPDLGRRGDAHYLLADTRSDRGTADRVPQDANARGERGRTSEAGEEGLRS